jgi:hypothetical protein
VAGKVTADFAVLGYDWDSDSNRVWFYKGGSSGPVKTKKVSLPSGASLTDAGVTIADFDKNGYGDLTLGSPRAGGSAQGAVYILPGTSTGPSGSARTITQSTSGVPGGREAWDNFGSDVSAADTNGDGYLDLAIGVQGEVIGDSYFSSGGLTVLRGGPSGITGTGARWYDVGTSGIAGETTEDGWLGASVHLRDYNRDNRAELVAFAPEAGRVYVLPGTSAGPTGTGSVMLTPPPSAAPPSASCGGSWPTDLRILRLCECSCRGSQELRFRDRALPMDSSIPEMKVLGVCFSRCPCRQDRRGFAGLSCQRHPALRAPLQARSA